ncbi:MAG TPA: DUF2877 domain-containing protein [Candidatus Cloacimonadota bacterium]|nr:DUF2877 domain-containing protein [Candidatus Cloacimonadota bacterium]HPT71606.1 DUF2877 domain-containing protein [Candidatus Cloacimonadota bacterium]
MNFIWQDEVVSVVHSPLGAGPYTIVEWGLPVGRIESLEITDDLVIINDSIQIKREESHIYHSNIDLTELDPELISKNMAFIHQNWIPKLPEKSLGFLLDPCKEIITDSAFDYNYMSLMRELYANLINDNSLRNIIAFRGYGYGKTPSGDDFIIGYMLGLQILIALGKNELSKLLEFIYADLLRKSSNRLVKLFVRMACEGSYAEHWKYLVASLTGMELNHTGTLLEQVLSVGETSGADTLVGLISCLDLEL